MKIPPFKCLFCLETTGPFVHVEHPIPESLGNDDLFIEPGFVCDTCNQYFGVKVENSVLSTPPFGIERVRADVKTKKGKHPLFLSPPHIQLYPTSFKDKVILVASPEYWNFLQKNSLLLLPHSEKNDVLIVRLLLKMGLELLLLDDQLDPYNSQFNSARKFARSPVIGSSWQMAYGIYPNQEDLVISQREDEISPLVTHQLYQYQIGIMQSGDVIFSFMYAVHIFVCNLMRPSIVEYTDGFNRLNSFALNIVDAKNL